MLPPLLASAEAAEDLIHVERTVLHYGKGDENPVLAMRFLDFQRGGEAGGARVAKQVAESQVSERCEGGSMTGP